MPEHTHNYEPQRICPMERAHHLESWWRKILQSPRRIVGEYVREGATVVDIGCGPGYFAVPMAKMAGKSGKIIAVDVQEGMLHLAKAKAEAAGLDGEVEFRLTPPERIGVEEKADFILAYYVVHETPDPVHFFAESREILKNEGKMLVVEPTHHVDEAGFKQMLGFAAEAGMKVLGYPKRKGGRAVLLGR